MESIWQVSSAFSFAARVSVGFRGLQIEATQYFTQTELQLKEATKMIPTKSTSTPTSSAPTSSPVPLQPSRPPYLEAIDVANISFRVRILNLRHESICICKVDHPLPLPDPVYYRKIPAFILRVGDIYRILHSEGQSSLNRDLPLPLQPLNGEHRLS